MRLLPALLLAFFTIFTGSLSAQGNSDPITLINGSIPNQSVSTAVGTPAIDLRGYFAVPSIPSMNPVVQFTVPGVGIYNVEMKADVAPLTVSNFLNYVNANRFTNSLIHRSNPTFRIFQGGGYIPNSAGTFFESYGDVIRNAPLSMEVANTLVHSRGTIAMARMGGSLNSATSEWFINTADNTSLWSPASALNADSYAAFGRVTGTGLTVVDAIAALPRLSGNVTVITSSNTSAFVTINSASAPANFGIGWTLLGATVANVAGNFVTLNANANATITSSTSVVSQLYPAPSPFSELPILRNLTFSEGPVPLVDLVKTTSVAVVPVFPTASGTASVVTFSAVSSDPVLVKPNISGSNLYLAAGRNLSGSATVTVTATDTNGNSVSQAAFTVTVTRKVIDFNADAIGDFVFQNNAGQIVTWFLNASGFRNGSATLSSALLGDYRVVGIADLNGDGNPDFLFQNGTGVLAAWYLNASGLTTSTAVLSTANLGDYKVCTLADLDHDGNQDIIFQNSIGQIAVWYLNSGGGIGNRVLIAGENIGDFRIRCATDMNNDGILDLVFQNNIGQIAVYYMSSTGGIVSKVLVSGENLGDYKIARAMDINGDGIADFVFQNNIGQIAVWILNASGVATSKSFLSTSNLGDYRLR